MVVTTKHLIWVGVGDTYLQKGKGGFFRRIAQSAGLYVILTDTTVFISELDINEARNATKNRTIYAKGSANRRNEHSRSSKHHESNTPDGDGLGKGEKASEGGRLRPDNVRLRRR